MKPIKALILDVDGVLTDGSVTFSESGGETKSLTYQDIDAVFEARRRGLLVALLSAESSPWLDFVGRRLEISTVVGGAKEKRPAIEKLARELSVSLEEVCYVADGDRDAPALAAVGLGLAPANATPAARKAARQVLKAAGGRGAVREALELLTALRTPKPASPPLPPAPEADISRVREWAQSSIDALKATAEHLAPRIAESARVIWDCVNNGGTLLIFGNGGSAADAQHFSAEFVGRFEKDRRALPALALTTDSSALTALGNDYGEETIFSRQVEALARPRDVAVAISTSGNSPNILRALEACRVLGVKTIGMTGRDGGKMADRVDLCLIVPATATARIQEAHAFIIHAICGLVESRIQGP
ncbi:MAG: SIS domain-containing protein [Planctomycetes bacterium]|nr:SIS domain-containing protein [Planctomycetota bacterium]